MARPAPTFSIGDRIAYSARFLRAIGRAGHAIGIERMTVTAAYPAQSDTMGGIIEFVHDDGRASGGLSCNFAAV